MVLPIVLVLSSQEDMSFCVFIDLGNIWVPFSSASPGKSSVFSRDLVGTGGCDKNFEPIRIMDFELAIVVARVLQPF